MSLILEELEGLRKSPGWICSVPGMKSSLVEAGKMEEISFQVPKKVPRGIFVYKVGRFLPWKYY